VLAILVTLSADAGPAFPQNQYPFAASTKERARGYENRCIADLRLLGTAQGTYAGQFPDKGYARRLNELGPTGDYLIGWELADGKADGYRFVLTPKPTHGAVEHYTIRATPIKRFATDQQSFFTDETGVIRATHEKRSAGPKDPPIDQ